MKSLVEPRSICLPSSSRMAALRGRIESALDEWASRWLGQGGQTGFNLAVILQGEVPSSWGTEVCIDCFATDAGMVWFRRREEDEAAFSSALMASLSLPFEEDNAWVSHLVSQARQACLDTVATAVHGRTCLNVLRRAEGVLPEALFSFGSGAVVFECPGLGVHGVVGSDVWGTVESSAREGRQFKRCELEPVTAALRLAEVRLQVCLAEVALELDRLLEMQVGDVLRLPQQLAEPFVVTCGDCKVAHGQLGEHAGHFAVQLQSLASS